MPRTLESAVGAILESRAFKKALETGETELLEKELLKFGKEVHNATCIRATKVYGSVKNSTADLVKQWIRNTPIPSLEFYPR